MNCAPASARAAALLVALAGAAPLPQLTLFADRFYRGDTQRFTADAPRLARPIAPQSLRIAGRWEVCTDDDYKGRCIEIDRDYAVEAGLGDGFTVRSLRHVAPGEGAGKPSAGAVPGGTSLAGVASRYWPAPTYGAERILACPGGKPGFNCAHDTAEEMCRRAGYRIVRYWQLQTVAGRVYLADILCTRSDDS
jgi:hypothetical protein